MLRHVGGLVWIAVSDISQNFMASIMKEGLVPVWNGSLDCSFVPP